MGKDYTERRQFARTVKRTYPEDFFQNRIFLPRWVSFHHKMNPLDEGRTTQGKVWCKLNEGLSCTAKGLHVGSRNRVVKMIVAISYGKGVI